MPFRSDAQRRFLYATDPKLAEKFSKDTPKGTNLPEKITARREALKKMSGGK